ncbi:MAG: MFS transporter [Prevotellaceae bacterium]|jgi:DHA3 family macrolide efflux protein-like MFS transporter|nr:MFS transporter [Prevotellaceae bacterium]
MNSWKKTFAIIWTGQFFSILSSYTVGFAIILWLSIKTESAEVMAYATIAALLPQALLGTVAGVFIDRWNRKTTMILADNFIAFCTLILSILFFMGVEGTWFIYGLLIMRSIGSAFHAPAMQASVPLLAPESELIRIAGINQTIQSVSNIAGPALGALLYSIMDIGWILLLDVLGAAIACTSLTFVKIPQPQKRETAEKPNVWKEMKEGIRAMMEQKGLALLFLFSIVVMFFIMPISALFPLMTLKHFGGTPFQMGIIETAWGVGALLGGVFLGFWKVSTNKVIIINLSYIILGISFVLSGILSPQLYILFIVLTALGGLSGALYMASFTTMVQEKIDPSALGRVFSMYGSVSIMPSVLGLLATGFIADAIGIASTFIYCGIIILIIGIANSFMPILLHVGKPKLGQ